MLTQNNLKFEIFDFYIDPRQNIYQAPKIHRNNQVRLNQLSLSL